ncbi:TPA: restriction endonuclease subunit S [Streptococcus suis]
MTPEQLKASILQRAMEGKLVPQDPNDEPASELLKRIKEEKEKLISEGKVKRDKKETEFFRGDDGKPYEKLADGTVQEVDLPYDIPESWEWVRLGAIVTAKGGKRIPKGYNLQEEDNGHPYLRVTDMKDGTIKPTNIKFAPDNVYTIIRDYTISSTDIYVTIAGTIGDVGIVPENFNNALLTENALKLMLTESINKMFLAHLLKSPLVQKQFKEVYNQVAQPKLSIRSTNSTIIPLPPLAEQKRIVAQIERALEQVEVYAESYHKLQELDKAFPDKLKKSILQYAMQGKLVAQDPNDEPVEVLLEKIRAEKQKLYEEGKLKKKDLAEIVVEKGDDNSHYGNNNENIGFSNSTLFKLPSSWCYVKFGGLVLFNIGKTPPRSEPNYWGNDIPWVSISDISNNGHIIKTKEYLSDFAINQKKVKIAPAGTLLMSFKLTIGKVALLEVPASHNEAIISIFPYGDKENIIRDYLMRFLPLISTAGNSKDAIKGKTLNSTSISGLLIPISNYREMKDIVTKVDLLFEKVAQL